MDINELQERLFTLPLQPKLVEQDEEEEVDFEDLPDLPEDEAVTTDDEDIDEPDAPSSPRDSEEQKEEKEEPEEEELEKQYFGKSADDEYYYLNKGDKGWYVTSADGKIVYPVSDMEYAEVKTNVVDFIAQAQKELEMTEISSDIFTRYFEPELAKEEQRREEEKGFEYDEPLADDDEEEKEEDEPDDLPFDENPFNFEEDEEKPIAIERKIEEMINKRWKVWAEGDEESVQEVPALTAFAAVRKFAGEFIKYIGKDLGGEDGSDMLKYKGKETGKEYRVQLLGVASAMEKKTEEEKFEGMKLVDENLFDLLGEEEQEEVIHEAHRGNEHPQSIFEELHKDVCDVGDDWMEPETEEEEFTRRKKRYFGESKTQVNEGVHELIHEIEGLTGDERNALDWAVRAGKISNEWPDEAKMTKRLRSYDFEEDEDLKIAYLKVVLAPLAYEMWHEAGMPSIAESKTVNEVRFMFDGFAFEVRLVEDKEEIVININDKQDFKFTQEFASLYRDDDGTISEDNLRELGKNALASLEEEFFHEIAAEEPVTDDEEVEETEEIEEEPEETFEESIKESKELKEGETEDLSKLSDEELKKEFEHAYKMATVGGDTDWAPYLGKLDVEIKKRGLKVDESKNQNSKETDTKKKNEGIVPDDKDTEETKIKKLMEEEENESIVTNSIFNEMFEHLND